MDINISSLYRRHIRIVPGVKSYVLASSFVFLLGLTITLLSWYVDKQRIASQEAAQLNEQVVALETDITNRLNIYEQILHGAAGLFRASDNVTRDEWSRYIQQYDIQKTYPGIAGVGYVQHVPAYSLNDYLLARQAEGLTNFAITPAGERPEYALLTYAEPYTDSAKKNLGYDIYTDSARSGPAKKARDSGKVGVSERLVLLSDKGVSNQPSFAMYVPLYKQASLPGTTEERQANLQGYVYAAYRSKDFFSHAINKSKLAAYSEVQIFDGPSVGSSALLYQSTDWSKYSSKELSPAYAKNILGHTWTFQFADPVSADNQDTQRSTFILIGGTTISFALAGFLFLIMLTRARAIVYAKQNEAQQAKDDLLSLASHQLRTPATAVKQYLGMILEGYTGDVDEKQLPALQKAYSSNERQLDTINQILYVAKADAGRLSINRNNFDLNLLIDDVVSDMTDTIEEKGQSIVIERSLRKLNVFADEASIRMVLENLLSNASKYSYDDATITVKTGHEVKEVFVSINDQGVGIAPQDYDKLFKKFSRIDNDLSLQVGGSGIGLYIDKVLIELHGGRIEVHSELNKGSTFTVFLPKTSANNLTDGDRKDKSLYNAG